MAVVGPESVTLEVPDLAAGVRFYTDAGLIAEVNGNRASFRCSGQTRPCLHLIGGAARKRLHHIALRAEGLDSIAARVGNAGGRVVAAPDGWDRAGLWLVDPHGMLVHLVAPGPGQDAVPQAGPKFEINSPGHCVRVRRPAVLPRSAYGPVLPVKLGHILLFTPDVSASVEFVTEVLGMGLADKVQDIIAFCCAVRNSDHHVLAFAKSPGIGFHHASFEVSDPDAVGRGGRDLLAKTGKGDWGFGRHVIGSNFFHYIQDPWGSWFEYYSDMDFIDDHRLWQPTDYEPEDSLASWAPAVPDDFVLNREASLV